jgi:hypothetical protein
MFKSPNLVMVSHRFMLLLSAGTLNVSLSLLVLEPAFLP